jgi:hypothetical protein
MNLGSRLRQRFMRLDSLAPLGHRDQVAAGFG